MTRSFFWLVPLLIPATLSAQYGGVPRGRAAAPRPAPAGTVTGQPAAPSPAARGLGSAPVRVPPLPAPSRFPPGSPSQALVPLDKPAAAAVANGSRPPARPASPTLDTVSASPEEKARALADAKEFRSLKVPARKVAPAVRKVLRLRWHKSLRGAAHKARAEHKPILWIQALGDLRGYT
jgi:hypothetical protein